MNRVLFGLVWAVLCSTSVTLVAQPRDQKVRDDKTKFEESGYWIYGDLAKGFAEAKKTGKPLLVVLRCIPCHECVKLDDELVETDKRLRPVLDQYVRVRIVSANGLDLSLFQYDTDQSYAVFIFNADGTIYGRYGTRSDRTHYADDVSIEGLTKALEGALELHADFPKYKAALAAKTGPAPDFPSPEKYPMLREKYGAELNYSGNVVQSCIHCHQIGDAQKEYHLSRGQLSDEVLFPYPHPKALGLILDPRERGIVLRAEEKSPAAIAGFQAGDEIKTLNGQPILSMADVQWVLHHIPASGGKVDAEVVRGGKTAKVSLPLESGWRQRDDIAWRASTWQLRRVAFGGMFLKPLPAEIRAEKKLPGDAFALKVEHVGQYAPHDRAKRAGLKAGDVVVAVDGRTDLPRETDLLAYALRRKDGKPLSVEVLREGKKVTLQIPAK